MSTTSPGDLPSLLHQAVSAHRRGDLATAERLYAQVLHAAPDNADALHLSGVLAAQRGDPAAAVERIGRALAVAPANPAAHLNLGNALRDLGRGDEALASYDRALTLTPQYPQALVNRGNVLALLGRSADAVASFDRALELQPNVDALVNRGLALQALGRHDDAAQSQRRALTLAPNHADAAFHLGNALAAGGRFDDAVAAYDRALAVHPDHAEAHNNRGNALAEAGRADEAIASFDRALALKPDDAEAHYNRGNALSKLNRLEDAIASYRRAIACRPDYAAAYNNLGAALTGYANPDQAIAAYDAALAIDPNSVEALANKASALAAAKRPEQAAAAFAQVLRAAPARPFARGHLLHARLQACDWNGTEAALAEVVDAVRSGRPADLPFPFLAISDSPADQQQCARTYAREKFRPFPRPLWTGEHYDHDRIRLAYLSADFFQHATSYLMAELFETHDRARFEVTAISFGRTDPDPMRGRLTKAFDRFVDAHALSDAQVARQMRALEIDIAVHAEGYTQDCRPGVLAYRPAPVQASYLAYPGTMGLGEALDYIIADPIVIPAEHRAFYDEQVVWLPECYQVNDSKRAIASEPPSRADAGLPESGFVFCCFNNNHKILPPVFDVWMRLLRQVDGSVLWLLEDNAAVARNLKREAKARGVAADRIVFAPRAPLAKHLARHRLADLFLDTLPYNAHTTASDALWAGLPVLTCLGTTFAGRVAASLLTAIGLPELITRTTDEYEALALALARDPGRLAAIKATLASNRTTTPLFDTQRFRRHIEQAYVTMWERSQGGEAPEAFAVAPL
ncbi:MAG TPA: tetratricopeptide repeat protein [Alphaproteobacteria bacterium]|nr:tetratricopeptide repeat protein [Alphaproteobacteria bacterium]